MCIKKVEAWAFGDKTYDHEIDATKAAIESIIGNPGVAKVIFSKADDLLPLLTRFGELDRAQRAGIAMPADAKKDPEGPDAPPMSPQAVRELLLSTFRTKAKDDKAGIVKIIRDAGYSDLSNLQTHATDMHVNALLARLMGNPVSVQVLDAQQHSATCRARATGFESDCNCGILIRHRSLYAKEG